MNTVAPGLRNLTRRTASDALGAFDRDEVAAPSIHVQNHAFHLYYAGRRGTRWGVGLLTSDDLVGWRVVAGGGAVLAGGGDGFDSLGVTDPDAFYDGASVRLVYVGMDGGKRALGRASRRAPAVAYAP